jgi:hypothetical protein
MPDAITVPTGREGNLRDALNASGWLPHEEVVAAGHLRQNKVPSIVSMVTGWVLVQLWWPRRFKGLPRHFALALTADRAVAFKCTGGSGEDSASVYQVRIRPGEEASFPRASVSISDLPKGDQSKGGTMTIDGQSFPVARPNLNGDPSTDELIRVLAGLPAPEPSAPVGPGGSPLIT